MTKTKTAPGAEIVRTYTADEAGRPAAVEAVGRAIVAAAVAPAAKQDADAWATAVKAAAIAAGKKAAPKWLGTWGLVGLAAGAGVAAEEAAKLGRGQLRSAIRAAALERAKSDPAALWGALWGLAAGDGDARKAAAKALYQAFCDAADVEVLKGQIAAGLRKGLTEGGRKAGVLPDRVAAEAARRRDAAILRAADGVEATLRYAGITDADVIAAARSKARLDAAAAWDKKHTKAP